MPAMLSGPHEIELDDLVVTHLVNGYDVKRFALWTSSNTFVVNHKSTRDNSVHHFGVVLGKLCEHLNVPFEDCFTTDLWRFTSQRTVYRRKREEVGERSRVMRVVCDNEPINRRCRIDVRHHRIAGHLSS
jgi:hypothetical protein